MSLLRLLRGCSGGGGGAPPDLNLLVDSDDGKNKRKQDLFAAAKDAAADAAAAIAEPQPPTPHLHPPAAAQHNNDDDRSSTGGAYGALAQTYASSSGGGGSNNQSLAGALAPALRVAAAEPVPASELLSSSSSSSNLWPRLRAAYSIVDLSSSTSSSGGGGGAAANNPPLQRRRPARAVDVNSGGAVFVLVFAPPPAPAPSTTTTAGATTPQPPPSPKREQLAVLKLPASGGRLATQAEALASELAAAMGVPTPACRLLRRPSKEWSMLLAAADAIMKTSSAHRSRRPSWASWSLGGGGSGGPSTPSSPSTPTSIPSLSAELRAPSCPTAALLLEFCPGTPLGRCVPALVAASLFASPSFSSLAHDAGAVLALDLLLDNADRLPLRKELGWRGNLGNALVLLSPPPSRLIAIDASVPRGRQLTSSSSSSVSSSCESQKAERVAQLVAADARFAARVLRTALAVPSLGKEGDDDDDKNDNATTATSSFQQGLRSALQRADSILGLLETVEAALRRSLSAFADEALPLMPPSSLSPPPSPSSFRSPAVSPRGRVGGRPVAPWAVAASTQSPSIPDLQDLTTATPMTMPAHLRPRPPPPPAATPPPLLSASTLAAITKAAATTTGALNALVAAWQDRLRRELEALAEAARDWQERRRGGRESSSLLLLGSYLGPYSSSSSSSSPNPLADAHDLAARLGPLLRRARLLVSAAEARAPDRVLTLPLSSSLDASTTAPCLYIGDAVSADCAHVLRRLGVKRVLCCAEELAWPPAVVVGLKGAARLGLVDGGGPSSLASRRGGGGGVAEAAAAQALLLDHFDRAVAWIDGAFEAAEGDERTDERNDGDGDDGIANPSSVLVHCAEGRSRSAAVVAAYLIARKGMSAGEALEAVRSCRPCASPKAVFVAALEAYEARKKGGS
jgi:hypothetical protein